MASNKKFNIGPLALTTTLTANVFNPSACSGGVNDSSTALYALIYHVRISNKTAGAVTFSLYRGATGANAPGTEFVGTAISVSANGTYDFYDPSGVRFDTANFLVGGASANTALTLQATGEIGVA